MPTRLTDKGLEISDTEEIRDMIINGDDDVPGMQQIYGEDAVFDTDSPDGQAIGIFAQAIRDIAECILQTYNSFDPDKAVGVSLDNRCAYNGVRKKGISYTIIPVNVEIGDTPTTLYGLNDLKENAQNLFSVYDNAGNEFYLMNTENLGANSSVALTFQAKDAGEVDVAPNTITKFKAITTNVKSVSNPNKPFGK